MIVAVNEKATGDHLIEHEIQAKWFPGQKDQ
jgi:hypothetical protein